MPHPRTGIATIAGLLLAACAATTAAQDAEGRKEVRLRESLAPIANPERGFYAPRMSHRMDGLERLRAQGVTLLLVEMDLRDFKDRDITPEKLDEVRAAFAKARENGLKVIFRAAYGYTDRDYRSDPKDLGRIRGHIKQLADVFDSGRDVLFAVQAGFLGPWGEWHGSNHGDPPSLEARKAVLTGLLDAVPAPRAVLVRRPMFVRDLYAGEPALTPEAAAEGGPLSRTGWHDDAFLCLPDDMGTFAERGWDRDRELAWCANHDLYAPFGGESVPGSARTPIDQVVREQEKFRTTYLNSAYHRGTIEGWRKAEYQGESGYAHVARRLGYRLVADRLRYPAAVAPGGAAKVELELKNVGFAPLMLKREVAIVLVRDGVQHRAVADVDPRRWLPGQTTNVAFSLPLPSDAPRGRWTLALHLPDPAPGLRDDGRFAVRLANEDVRFLEPSGLNVLAEDVEVR